MKSQNGKKILMVSDIITVFSGGIEMYMLNASKLLRTDGFVVDYFGIKWSKEIIKRFRGYLLPCTGLNIVSALGLLFKCSYFRPDVIWFHSINRYHGWLPVLVSGWFKSQKLMMYHDLGYFHPFPSLVTQEDQVLPWSLKNFMRMGRRAKREKRKAKDLITDVLVVFKFFSIELLRLSLIYTVDNHLVPSEFMVKYLKAWGIDEQKIEVLPHFIVNGL